MDTEDDIRGMIAEEEHLRGVCDVGCHYCEIESDKQEKLEQEQRAQEMAGDPPSDFARRTKLSVEMLEVRLPINGRPTYFATEGAPYLKGEIFAESLSCTGPTVVEIRFNRAILHEMEVGCEDVSITLAEIVR